MSVPDWFSNLIQTAEAAEQQRAQPSQDLQAQHALAQALTNSGYDAAAQQQQLSSTGQSDEFLDQPQHRLESHIKSASTSQYEGDPSRWMHSGDEIMNEPQSHLQQLSLDQLAFQVNNGGASSNGNPQPQVSSSSTTSNGLVSAYPNAPHPHPIPSHNNIDQNPSSSSSSNLASSAVFPSSTSPAKRPRRASSTSSFGPTPSPQSTTKRRKSDATTPKKQEPVVTLYKAKGEEEKLDQAMDKLKEKVPALRTFFHILPVPSPTPDSGGLVDGVLPPKADGGAATVVKTSASYVHVLQRERDAGKRMIAGLEGVLKATGGEEMLDAWRAQLAVLEEEREEADAAAATLVTQSLVNQNGKVKDEVDRPLLDLNSAPSSSSLQPSDEPSSSTTTINTNRPGLISLPPQPQPQVPLISSSTTTITINPSSIDPLHPNYYDPTSYAIDSHDFMTYPSGDPVVASGSADGEGNGGGAGGGPKSKQEIAREKNREKQRRFRERQKARVAELEAKLRELKKGEAEGEELEVMEVMEEEGTGSGVKEEEGERDADGLIV